LEEDLYLAESKSPRFFYGYVVVLAAFLILAVVMGAAYSFGVFLKPLSAEFGWTRAAISGAFSLYMILHGFLYILAGKLNDRFGPRIVMTVCGVLLGLGYLLMSQISTIWQLYLVYGIIIGVAMSGGFVPLVSTVARWFVKRRGLMTGFVVSGVGAGGIIMPQVANWLISDFGWRYSYTIIGVIALVLITVAAQFLRRDPGQVGQLPYGESGTGEGRLNVEAGGFSLREAIHNRQFWMFGAIFLCFGFSLQVIMVHIVPHAIELGISAAVAASILATIGGVSIAGRIMIGSAGDRVGNKSAAVFCLILMALDLLWLLAAKEVWMLYLFAAIFGFAFGGFVVLMSPITAELFGLGSHGVIFGSIMLFSNTGEAIGPLLAGYIFDIAGSYNQAFLVCIVVSVIGAIFSWLLTLVSSKGGTNDTRRST